MNTSTMLNLTKMNDTVVVAWGIAMLAMFFYTPFKMAKGIYFVSDVSKVKFLDVRWFQCCIPIYNMVTSEIKYFGHIWLYTYSQIAVFVTLAARLFTFKFMNRDANALQITVILFLLSLLFNLIANCIFVFIILNDTEATTPAKKIFYTIVYPLGQMFIGDYLYMIIANKKREHEQFNSVYE